MTHGSALVTRNSFSTSVREHDTPTENLHMCRRKSSGSASAHSRSWQDGSKVAAALQQPGKMWLSKQGSLARLTKVSELKILQGRLKSALSTPSRAEAQPHPAASRLVFHFPLSSQSLSVRRDCFLSE